MGSIRKIISGLVSIIGLFIHMDAFAQHIYPRMNMRHGVTPISRDIYLLHMTIFSICVVIGIIVFTLLAIALIKHRKSVGHEAAQFSHSKYEIVWATLPLVILVIMAIPATIVLREMNNSGEGDLTIKITGYQWKWQYEYLDYGIKFFSNLATPIDQIENKAPKDRWYLLNVDQPLVVPTHKKIRFLITANDVIHSWWVPALGVKKDGIPGFIHESWAEIEKPGTYRGQCAELCGVHHGFMPIVVIAKNEADFNTWLAAQRKTIATSEANVSQKMTYDELMKLGQATYTKYCGACHQPTGLGITNLYPALKGSSVAVGHPVARHIDVVLNGIPGSAMQAFGPQLSDTEIAAVITYERNAWGNNTGEYVQPADVNKQRHSPVIPPENSATRNTQGKIKA